MNIYILSLCYQILSLHFHSYKFVPISSRSLISKISSTTLYLDFYFLYFISFLYIETEWGVFYVERFWLCISTFLYHIQVAFLFSLHFNKFIVSYVFLAVLFLLSVQHIFCIFLKSQVAERKFSLLYIIFKNFYYIISLFLITYL